MTKGTTQANFYFIALSAALGGFLFGYDTAVISGTIRFVKNQFALDTLMEGWFVSSALVGCILGVMFAGELSDRFGRKRTLILSGLLFLASALGCALASSFSGLVMYRIMGGVGVGVASMASPLYISEISPARIRGRMVALYQFAITLGILVAYFANAWLLQYSTTNPGMAALGQKVFVDEVWRGMFGSEVLPALLFLITMLLVPFSPRWLAARKKDDQALKVLKRINNAPGIAEQELTSIQEALAYESQGTWSVLWKKGIRVAVFAGIALALLCQFTGINAIIYYGPRIMEEAGLQLSDALGGQVLIGMVNAGATVIAILTIDRLGRKKLMKAGTAGMFVSLLVVGVLFFTGQTQGSLLLTFILLFIFCFAFGYGPVFWVLLAEIYPTKVRGRAMSVATFALWGATALIGQLVPWMLEVLSPAGTFFVFALCCIPVFFVLRLVPETKERSLEEIEMLWGRSH